MPTDTAAGYFQLPQWREREQLLRHLLTNTPEIQYLRGPAGAGKTRFALTFAETLAESFYPVWLDPGRFWTARQAIKDRLQAPSDGGDREAPAESVRPLLLFADDADDLTRAELEELLDYQALGAHLLLIGHGRLPQGPALDPRRVQFVDLPAFTEEQSLAFLAAQRPEPYAALGLAGARRLHAAAQGRPGPLLETLTGIPGTRLRSRRRPKARAWRRWSLVGVAILLALGVVLTRHKSASQQRATPPGGQKTAMSVSPAASAMPDSGAGRVIAVATGQAPAGTPPAPAFDSQPRGQAPAATPVAAAVTPTEPAGAPHAPKATRAPAVTDAVIDAAIKAAAQPRPDLEARRVAPPTSERNPEPATRGQSWLRRQPPASYTLQLVAGSDRRSIEHFVANHALHGAYAVFLRTRDGRPWYSLISGSYRDRAQALAARARLSPQLRRGAWPRSFASVFKQMRL